MALPQGMWPKPLHTPSHHYSFRDGYVTQTESINVLSKISPPRAYLEEMLLFSVKSLDERKTQMMKFAAIFICHIEEVFISRINQAKTHNVANWDMETENVWKQIIRPREVDIVTSHRPHIQPHMKAWLSAHKCFSYITKSICFKFNLI